MPAHFIGLLGTFVVIATIAWITGAPGQDVLFLYICAFMGGAGFCVGRYEKG